MKNPKMAHKKIILSSMLGKLVKKTINKNIGIIIIPPIVGVFLLFRCVIGPSALIFWSKFFL